MVIICINKIMIITKVTGRMELFNLIKNSNKQMYVLFSSPTCGPCKSIKQSMLNIMNNTNENILWCYLDISDSGNANVYSYYKRYGKVYGVPALMVFNNSVPNQTNEVMNVDNMLPVDVIHGGNIQEIINFLSRTGWRPSN
jgi:thiol-disulfide isomerase/thioredoxin